MKQPMETVLVPLNAGRFCNLALLRADMSEVPNTASCCVGSRTTLFFFISYRQSINMGVAFEREGMLCSLLVLRRQPQRVALPTQERAAQSQNELTRVG